MASADLGQRDRSLFARIFREPDTGRVAIVQMPNLPLAVFLIAAGTRAVSHPAGTVGTVVSAVAGLGLVVWSVGEIGWGDSLFRRFLGAAVLIGLVVSLVR
jgi:hypothetical protein